VNRVILANSNKLGWTTVLVAVSFGISLLPLLQMSGVEIEYLAREEWIRRLLIVPLTVSFYVFVVCFALVGFDSPETEATGESVSARQDLPEQRNLAQVRGVIWLNPSFRRDCPTQWRILRTLGLIKEDNDGDIMQGTAAHAGTSWTALTIAAQSEGKSLEQAHESAIDEMLAQLGRMRSELSSEREDIGEIRVEHAIPAYRLDPVEVQEYVRTRIAHEYAAADVALGEDSSNGLFPDVHVMSGGANVGFASLDAALDYLTEHPAKRVWVMNWGTVDCPSADKRSNENMTLLVLGGPGFKGANAPLAWIGKAATGNIRDYVPKPGAVRAIEAWRDAVAMAAANANREVADIDYVIHDAGASSDVAVARLGTLGRALTETLAAFDYRKQIFNTAASLGDMGAASALTNVAMAIGRAEHVGNTVLVAGTTDSDRPVAVVVVPTLKRRDAVGRKSGRYSAHGGSSVCGPWWGGPVTSADNGAGLSVGIGDGETGSPAMRA